MVYIKGNALYLEEPEGWTDSITDEEFALWGREQKTELSILVQVLVQIEKTYEHIMA